MGKYLHKVFKTVVKDILQEFPPLGESGSEVSHFIPEPRNCAEVTKFSDDINKTWIKANLKKINNLVNNQTFLVEDTDKDEPVTPCIDVYKAKIQSDGSLDQLKLRIVLRGDLQNKELVGDTWSPTASMRTLKYFSSGATKHKARVHHLDFIGAFLQAKVNNGVFVNLDSIYTDYFPEYAKYFGRAFRLLNSMYGIIYSGNLFDDELTESLFKTGFTQYRCQMSIHYKYAPDGWSRG